MTVRKLLDIKFGRKIQHPTKFLISQIKTDIDAVKLVRAARKGFE